MTSISFPRRDQGIWNNDRPSFSGPRSQPLEVLLVGLSRTGTTSMLEAMKALGYGDIWNSREMLRRHQIAFCGEIFRSKLTGIGPKVSIEKFESVLGESRCVSGEFVAVMAEELIAAYPDAKIILTVRSDEERWLRSVTDTMWYNYSTWSHWLLRHVHPQWKEQKAFLDTLWNLLFAGDPRAHGLRVYREHNALVKRVTEPQRLLIYNVEQGWEPLCRFLGKDVPHEKFPWTNTVEEHRRLFGEGRKKSLEALIWTNVIGRALPVVLVSTVIWLKRTQVHTIWKNVLGVMRSAQWRP